MTQRVVWDGDQRSEFFDQIDTRSTGFTWQNVASSAGINPRTLLNWRNGSARIPYSQLVYLSMKHGISIPDGILLVDEYSHLPLAGRMGGLARLAKYGPPGTSMGRRRGGLAAIKAMRLAGYSFVATRDIKIPRRSEQLAEFIGIILGDGSVSKYQVCIFGRETTDSQYKFHIQKLGKELFGLNGAISLRKGQDCWRVAYSSIRLVKFFNTQGLASGSKGKYQADFPDWIKNNQIYAIACVRGMFDTDGSVYLDRHRIGGKDYFNISVAITSYIPTLLGSIGVALKNMGFSPTISVRRNLLLRKSKEIEHFFDMVKPANRKHLQRYEGYRFRRSSAGFS